MIIFEEVGTYLNLNQWNREMIDKYCLDFGVGMVLFVHSSKNNHEEPVFRKVGGSLRYRLGYKGITLDCFDKVIVEKIM